jgi:hypothetical protein
VIQTALCVADFLPESKIIVIVDNLQAGHMVPSGAAQDRQLWFELTAFKGGSEIYQSGHVPAGTDAIASPDEDLWLMRDCMFDEQGKETHLFWDAVSFDSNSLPAPVTLNPMEKLFYQQHKTRAYPQASTKRLPVNPDRIVLKVWFQAFPYAVFDEFTPDLKTIGYSDNEIAVMRGKLGPMQITANSVNVEAGRESEPAELEWTDTAATTSGVVFRNTSTIKDVPAGIWVKCLSATNMRLGVDTEKADVHKLCKP